MFQIALFLLSWAAIGIITLVSIFGYCKYNLTLGTILLKSLLILVAVVFAIGMIYGGILGDYTELESVGSIMCLSCMGIE